MQTQRVLISAFHVVALLACAGAVNLRSSRNQEGEQFFNFDYSQHGADWMAGTCSSKARQSPIDLPLNAIQGGVFNYKYEPITAPFDFMNNGHSFSADFAGLGYGGITYKGAYYGLMNINVHSVSEHSWGGAKKPLELHLVHKHYATEALLIVAVGVESNTPLGKLLKKHPLGKAAFAQVNSSSEQLPFNPIGSFYKEPPAAEPNFNPALQAFLKSEPPAVNMKVNVFMTPRDPLDLTPFFQGGMFFEYAGSLTAPPCAEIATWLVRKDPIKASDKQVLYLHDAVYKTTADFGNYRSQMPLNGREIHMMQALMEDPPKTVQATMPIGGDPQQSDREFRAMKWSMDAMTIAKGATDYIRDLDQRLRNAAQAHADALAPRLEPLSSKDQAGHASPNFGVQGPPTGQALEMDKTAKMMSRKLAEVARAEIEDATKQISEQAKQAALNAAMEASGLVRKGAGNNAALANLVASPVAAVPAQAR